MKCERIFVVCENSQTYTHLDEDNHSQSWRFYWGDDDWYK